MEICGCTTKIKMPYEVQFCPLHAAAPELLEACRGAIRALSSLKRNKQYLVKALHDRGWPSEWLDGAERNLEHSIAAIAKAEGKSEKSHDRPA